MVDRTTPWKAGTFPQQLCLQDLVAAGFQHDEPPASLLTLTEGGTERTVRARSAVRFPEENNSHFLHVCLVVNECNSQLHHQTKKTVRLEMRLCFKEDKKTV